MNTDIEQGEGLAYLDATERFPLEDASFDYVASEHVIEHLPFEGGMNMLAESFRVLKPGGKVRVATPKVHRALRGSPVRRGRAAVRPPSPPTRVRAE